LGFDRSEPVFRVIVRTADQIQELAVELGGGRGDDLEIGEDPVVAELLRHLTEELPLSPVLEVVDGESGDDQIKRSEWRERIFQVPPPDLDARIVTEPISGVPEHGR
jgi:hypothetical protein